MSNSTLLDKLKEYSTRGAIPMHMPGHKRNAGIGGDLELLGASYDITEIDGFDNLHGATGILAEAMDKAAKLWNSGAAYFLVNGSTCGILAGIRSSTRYGDRVLIARNCHKSVYHALELCGLNPIFLVPPIDQSFGIDASVAPCDVARALSLHPDIRLVVLTSPTYEGVISDIPAICALAHDRGIPVLVDEAHGAHLGFSDYFRGGAVEAGADLVIQSLHKTLPSLTQTAIAHVNGNLVNRAEFARQLSIFETSSPSYLLMASIDSCVNLLQTDGCGLFQSWQNGLEAFCEQMKDCVNLRILCYGRDSLVDHPLMHQFDPSKIVISTRSTSLTGIELMELLRRDYTIELEMAAGDYAVAMTGLGTTEEHLSVLAKALLEIDRAYGAHTRSVAVQNIPLIPKQVCGVAQALSRKTKLVSAQQAAGQVSGAYIWAYPPGIPLIIPGERINREFIDGVEKLEQSGIRLNSTRGNPPASFEIVETHESD